jgi:hypothetical protein
MFIDLIQCTDCGKRGRPGAAFNLSIDGATHRLHCNCGNAFDLPDPRDQCILSDNVFVRLGALSNYQEGGFVDVTPGGSTKVTFRRAFDYPCRAFLAPLGNQAIYAKEAYLDSDCMVILAGRHATDSDTAPAIEVSWSVYGLVGIDVLPAWNVQFYAAATHLANNLFKPALLDYAGAFELFLEEYLRSRLERRFSADCAELILRKSWRVEDRCKDILELASGHRMTERVDVYQPWDIHVRKPRNDLAHGKRVPVGPADAENAHQATYQAIRWIESL